MSWGLSKDSAWQAKSDFHTRSYHEVWHLLNLDLTHALSILNCKNILCVSTRKFEKKSFEMFEIMDENSNIVVNTSSNSF